MLITLNIIFFVVLGIVLFLMWRKIKAIEIMAKDNSKVTDYLSTKLGDSNLERFCADQNMSRLQTEINNLKSNAKSHDERISNTFMKIGLLANTLGYEYQPDKTTPPGYEPAKFVKKQKSGAK